MNKVLNEFIRDLALLASLVKLNHHDCEICLGLDTRFNNLRELEKEDGIDDFAPRVYYDKVLDEIQYLRNNESLMEICDHSHLIGRYIYTNDDLYADYPREILISLKIKENVANQSYTATFIIEALEVVIHVDFANKGLIHFYDATGNDFLLETIETINQLASVFLPKYIRN
jgi:hypothetical protein